MQYGLSLPIGGECADPRILAELAHIAEDAGWDGIFLEDYIQYMNDNYHSLPGAPTYDPWVALAAMAMRTQRIRLGTEVTPLPRRRPWKLARETVSVDILSGGRLVLGVGSGDPREAGFAQVGEEMDGRKRAEMLDESLDILAGLWSGQPFTYHGKQYSVDEVTFLPTPVQSPRIPIWVGGGWPNPGPTQRAARWDGSFLYKQTPDGSWQDMTPDDVRSLKEGVERQRAASTPFDIAIGGVERRADWEQERAHIRAIAEAGATWWVEWLPAAPLDVMRPAVERGPLRVDERGSLK